MNKRSRLFIVGLCVFSIVGLSARTKASWGIKLNGNLTNVKLTDYQSDNKFNGGGSVGGFFHLVFNEHVALQLELLFNYTETNIRFSGEKNKYKYAGVEIPVYVLEKYPVGNGKLFVGAGPHIGYGFSVDSRIEKLPQGACGENVIELDHWYSGISTLIGYECKNRISVHGGYQLSVDLNSGKSRSDVNTQTMHVGIGYRF
ncbi:MAG: PorT family protein [Tannerellaceae bacterium]|nr:PorT family protein [Tannerellaceae bacterium]